MDSRRCNTDCLKYIFKFCQFFGSAPLYDFEANFPIKSNLYKLYTLILLIIVIGINVTCFNSLRIFVQISESNMKMPHMVSSLLYGFPLDIHPILQFYVTWMKRKEWNYILRTFVCVDKYFKGSAGTSLYCFGELLLGSLFIIYVYFAGIYFKYAVPDAEIYLGLAKCVIFVRSVLIYNVAIMLGYRFGELNKKLEICKTKQVARDLTKIYYTLSECVKKFNQIFAFDLFLLFLEMFLTLVVVLNFSIHPYRRLVYWDTWLYTSRLLQAIFQVVCVSAIVRSCEMCEGNARRTGRLAFKIIRERGSTTEMYCLRGLADIRPRFSAGGLIAVTSKNLIITWGLVFSYLIIALTMNKK